MPDPAGSGKKVDASIDYAIMMRLTDREYYKGNHRAVSHKGNHRAVSHQFPSGNQARNHCHQKFFVWLVLAVFLWFWLSFELVWLV